MGSMSSGGGLAVCSSSVLSVVWFGVFFLFPVLPQSLLVQFEDIDEQEEVVGFHVDIVFGRGSGGRVYISIWWSFGVFGQGGIACACDCFLSPRKYHHCS